MSEWQPIETAPKDGTVVLGHWDGFIFPVQWEKHRSMPGPLWGWRVGNWEKASFLLFVEPTHWMPLPSPPSPDLSSNIDEED